MYTALVPTAFFSYAFRPFFLLNSLFAVIAIALWIAMLNNQLPGLAVANPMLWHGHEMLIGFALATIAGFLLTAVATWTSRPPVSGRTLVWLVATWLAGRVTMLFSDSIPHAAVVVIDMLFPVSLVVLVAREIIGGGSRRNYPIVIITSLIALLNLGFHLGHASGFDRTALFLLVHLVLLMITVIAGRIIPNFTANWMRAHSKPNPPASRPLIDRATIALTVLTGLAASFMPASLTTAFLALAAAVSHAVRLSGWRGFATTEEPLLFVLHAAYLWLPLGCLLTGLSALRPACAYHGCDRHDDSGGYHPRGARPHWACTACLAHHGF